ncbi:hypothetical protein JHK87_012236 [Glycine soja]|nr:hypothetical protein JHK87_012236 [Glycine soja]
MIFLQSIEESQKSLEDIKTKLQEVETLEEALKDDLKKLKTNLGEAEAEILRTHEASFKKALYQVKLFLKDVDISFFDVDKDVDHQGELVNEA